jgi:hypothetical protein
VLDKAAADLDALAKAGAEIAKPAKRRSRKVAPAAAPVEVQAAE